jgi:hypothetical protein
MHLLRHRTSPQKLGTHPWSLLYSDDLMRSSGCTHSHFLVISHFQVNF